MLEPLCKAGISPRQITGGEQFGWLKRIPCVADNRSGVVCPSYCEPTPEEVAADEAEWEAVIQRMETCLPLIAALKQEFSKEGGSGTRPCPVCGNNLHFSVSSYNGHVHGQCETKDCLNWME